jgi:hypothetical protein
MKRLFKFGSLAFVMAVAVLLAPIEGQAQPSSDRIEVCLPYPVTLGRNIIQPGTYTIEPLNVAGGDAPVLLISGNNGTSLAAAAKIARAPGNRPQSSTSIVLTHSGGNYYFDKIWVKGGIYGYEFKMPGRAANGE